MQRQKIRTLLTYWGRVKTRQRRRTMPKVKVNMNKRRLHPRKRKSMHRQKLYPGSVNV